MWWARMVKYFCSTSTVNRKRNMKFTTVGIIAALVLLLHFTMGCGTIARDVNYQLQAKTAEANVEQMFEHLPSPPGATLLDRYDGSTGGQILECGGRQIQALFGTNSLSFEEVLNFYGEALPKAGWTPLTIYDTARDFSKDNKYIFAVSNLYDVSMVRKNIVRDAKSKFKTLYLIEIITSVTNPVPTTCRGG